MAFAIAILGSLAFFLFISLTTLLLVYELDSMTFSYPMLFHESFVNQAQALCAGMSIYFGFFLLYWKLGPFRQRHYGMFKRQNNQALRVTEFNGRVWSLIHTITRFFFAMAIIVTIPGFHEALVNQPIIKFAVYLVAGFFVWDSFFVFTQVFKLGWRWNTLVGVGLAIWFLVLPMYTNNRWQRAIETATESRMVFRKHIQQPVVRFKPSAYISSRRINYRWVVNSRGQTWILGRQGEVALSEVELANEMEIGQFGRRISRPHLLVLDSRLPLKKVYSMLSAPLFQNESAVYFQIINPGEQTPWWVGTGREKIGINIPKAQVYSDLMETKLKEMSFDTVLIYPKQSYRLNGVPIGESELKKHITRCIENGKVLAHEYRGDITYQDFIAFRALTFEALYELREQLSLSQYATKYDLLDAKHVRSIRQETSLRVHDMSLAKYWKKEGLLGQN